MISKQHFAMASRIGVSVTLPELECDIDAQFRALADPDHPKRAVFLARHNSLGDRKLAPGLFVEHRSEGSLITTDATMAALFGAAEFITDRDIAAMLGYPEVKADVLLTDDGLVVQSLDADGCVVFEAAATQFRVAETVAVAEAQMPFGGEVKIVTPYTALSRRLARMN